MKNTTLCYIENEKGEYLMLHRVKKQNDLNHDKWIGVGGKCEEAPNLVSNSSSYLSPVLQIS